MKHRVFGAILALALAPTVAAAASVGVGAFGGMSFPILYDLASSGAQYGLRVPIRLMPLLSVEPFYAQSALGDVDETFAGQPNTRSGPDVYTFGGNVLFHFGEGRVQFYPFVGIGSTKIEQASAEDVTDTTLDFGLGLGFIPAPRFAIDLRGELSSVVTGDTSRKFGNLTVGVSYALFGLP